MKLFQKQNGELVETERVEDYNFHPIPIFSTLWTVGLTICGLLAGAAALRVLNAYVHLI